MANEILDKAIEHLEKSEPDFYEGIKLLKQLRDGELQPSPSNQLEQRISAQLQLPPSDKEIAEAAQIFLSETHTEYNNHTPMANWMAGAHYVREFYRHILLQLSR